MATQEWFRSSKMEYASVVMQESCAHQVLAKLGRLGIAQFVDLNKNQTAMQRHYIPELQRIDVLERKMEYFDGLIEHYKIDKDYEYDIEVFLNKVEQRLAETNTTSLLDELEGLIDAKNDYIRDLNNFRSRLRADYNYQLENKYVVEKAKIFLSEFGLDENLGYADGLHFQKLTGTLLQEDKVRFDRMVFRSTRGNCLTRFEDIEDPLEDIETGEHTVKKVVFVVFYQAGVIGEKVKRICDAFSAQVFEDVSTNSEAVEKIESELRDRQGVLEKNRTDIVTHLSDLAKWVDVWKWTLAREKSIYFTLNMFNADIKGVLRAECWVLASSVQLLQNVVYEVHEGTGGGTQLPSSVTVVQENVRPAMPPTHFRTNKFTKVFQGVVDTYGVPRYREANPAVFASITFPFSFGIMFGDFGHGILLTLFAAFVVYNEKKLVAWADSEMLGVVYNGRYFMLLMGAFATYCGLMYNDYFAMPMRLFSVTWEHPDEEYAAGDSVQYEPTGDVYPLGIDPTWIHAENGLLFLNSVKMKMAVIFGVIQMMVGISLKIANAIYRKNYIDLFFEAIPQFLFMGLLIGYMCVLIVLKWSLDWGAGCSREDLNCSPPSLITTMINMVLNIGTVEADQIIYEGQADVQVVLLLVAVLMIPLMLVPKPYILVKRIKAHQKEKDSGKDGVKESLLGENEQKPEAAAEEDEEHSTGDIWIHQAIETIEFCLATISNTASYLRLWALSLAHSQLSHVFLTQTLLNFIAMDGAMGVIMAFVGYAGFAAITFAVIMVMDQLECFLHALRLQWVEFQSKFFGGDGVKFSPLNFSKTLRKLGKADA